VNPQEPRVAHAAMRGMRRFAHRAYPRLDHLTASRSRAVGNLWNWGATARRVVGMNQRIFSVTFFLICGQKVAFPSWRTYF